MLRSFRIGTATFIYYGLLDTVVVSGAECVKTPSVEGDYLNKTNEHRVMACVK